MKVGFYCPAQAVIVQVEEPRIDRSSLHAAASMLSSLWQSGRHKLPSSIWCVFDQDSLRIFQLARSGKPPPFQDVAKAAAVHGYSNQD